MFGVKIDSSIQSNFFNELYNEICNETNTNSIDNNDENICLITLEPLEEYHIKLNCGHTFNYEPLFNEVKFQKNYFHKQVIQMERIRPNHIRCPYCRHITPKLLPLHPVYKNRITRVNIPDKYSMIQTKCCYKYKSGKRKGEECLIDCYYSHCSKHLHHMLNNKKIQTKKNIIDDNDVSIDENTIVEQNNTNSNQCIQILKTGKNKGKQCKNKNKYGDYCGVHKPKE